MAQPSLPRADLLRWLLQARLGGIRLVTWVLRCHSLRVYEMATSVCFSSTLCLVHHNGLEARVTSYTVLDSRSLGRLLQRITSPAPCLVFYLFGRGMVSEQPSIPCTSALLEGLVLIRDLAFGWDSRLAMAIDPCSPNEAWVERCLRVSLS
ncbi:hypothetical protein VNO77_39011 [Canavalia gladiata]|uniref:Uncharacterized protein n=1 Tax=Canavalia gladiata TaxID=3824 RepID=A0AAN9KDM6_CANGL